MEKTCKNKGCENIFVPFSSIQKYCCWKCFKENEKPKRKTYKRINKDSLKRKQEKAIYLKKRIDFLNKPENKICPVTNQPTTEVHHKKGRIGTLLNDERYWLAVSRKGHQRIENNPIWAKKNGFSLDRLSNND